MFLYSFLSALFSPEPQAMPMTSSSHSHRNPAHYTDTHPDRRTDHPDRRNEHTDSQHDKQPSRDSTGSRSSGHGSMDGPNHQEGRSGWMDTTPGDRDGFASGDERISRHNYSDHSEGRKLILRFINALCVEFVKLSFWFPELLLYKFPFYTITWDLLYL